MAKGGNLDRDCGLASLALHGVRMMDHLPCLLCQVNMKGALRECYVLHAHNLAQCPTLRMSIIKHAQLSRIIISQTKAMLV